MKSLGIRPARTAYATLDTATKNLKSSTVTFQNESPAASETVLLALALEKMEGCARVAEA